MKDMVACLLYHCSDTLTREVEIPQGPTPRRRITGNYRWLRKGGTVFPRDETHYLILSGQPWNHTPANGTKRPWQVVFTYLYACLHVTIIIKGKEAINLRRREDREEKEGRK